MCLWEQVFYDVNVMIHVQALNFGSHQTFEWQCITVSTKSSTTVFNIANTANEHIRMISEGSCDTEVVCGMCPNISWSHHNIFSITHQITELLFTRQFNFASFLDISYLLFFLTSSPTTCLLSCRKKA
jgi:hypothetical protein